MRLEADSLKRNWDRDTPRLITPPGAQNQKPNTTILKTKQRPDFRMSCTTRPPVFAPIRTRSRDSEARAASLGF